MTNVLRNTSEIEGMQSPRGANASQILSFLKRIFNLQCLLFYALENIPVQIVILFQTSMYHQSNKSIMNVEIS